MPCVSKGYAARHPSWLERLGDEPPGDGQTVFLADL